MRATWPLGFVLWIAVMGKFVEAQGVSAQAHPSGAWMGHPKYVAERQVVGVIHVWGSPQMGDLLKLYEAGFAKVQPGVRFEDSLKSTVTAVAGVYTGRAEIGLLGREIWSVEEMAFQSVEGHAPTVVEVATGSYDVPKATFALMVFVPRGNPLAGVSMEQLRRVFGNGARGIHTWGELGLTGAWAKRPVHLVGFTRDNDKAQIFSKLVFREGESWNCGLREFANEAGTKGADAGELIVRAVEKDPDAIGISNMHYATAGVRALAVEGVEPSKESVKQRRYPLSRAVYVVVDRQTASDAVREFLRFVLSRQGQEAVAQEGNYVPLTEDRAAKELGELGEVGR